MPKLQDITGIRFGRLVVLSRDEDRILPCGQKCKVWKCKCDCGVATSIISSSLKSGDTKSCGCLRLEIQKTSAVKHGASRTREYKIYRGMIFRCTNKNSNDFANYGGRGVSVHPEWILSFERFLFDVGLAPSDNHTLDRFPDTNGNYEPSNVRWATRTQQAQNRRNTIVMEFNGKLIPLSEVARLCGISYQCLRRRYILGYRGYKLTRESTKKIK